MPGSIWVIADQWRGRISDVTFEALALGRELATQAGARLEAVVLGHDNEGLVTSLGAADHVILVDHPSLADPLPGPWSAGLSHLLGEHTPEALLIPLTNATLGVGTLLGAQLNLAVVNFCIDASIEGDALTAHAVMYGGKMVAQVRVAKRPALLGVRPGARPADAGRAAGTPSMERVTPDLGQPDVRVRRYIEADTTDIDLTRQDVLVAVGRGIGSKDNVGLAEELARALGGAVCGSRPVIDQGWMPLSRQVGKSGMSVKPRLYVAAGVSGAPEHTEGMKGADLIVAINTDPHAPIFDIAHYGIVGDALDVLPALTGALAVKHG